MELRLQDSLGKKNSCSDGKDTGVCLQPDVGGDGRAETSRGGGRCLDFRNSFTGIHKPKLLNYSLNMRLTLHVNHNSIKLLKNKKKQAI